MHGLHLVGMSTAQMTDACVTKLPMHFVMFPLHENKVQLVHTKS
jgi:hypothetical protein